MKIVIAGNYGAKNLGDEMILEGLLKKVKSSFENAEIVVFSGDPKETEEKFKIKSVEKFPAGIKSLIHSLSGSLKRTSKEVKECDYFILGGGGLFGGGNFKANLIWAIQTIMAYKYDKKVIMLGQSIGKPKGFLEKTLIRKVFLKAHSITLRDDDSKEILQELGVKKEIKVEPDMAFNIEISQENVEKKKLILVALRTLKNIPNGLISEIAKFLDDKKDEGYAIELIDFQKGDSSERDSLIHENLMRKMKSQGVAHIKTIDSANEIIKKYQSAEFVLGMRLHSIVTAIITKTPFIAINYSPKVRGLIKTHDLERNLLEMNEVTQESLEKLFKTINHKIS
jgi:polysaccharide pyruvyl transferase CsaB